MFPDFRAKFLHSLVFQVVQQRLVFAAFAEIEKGSGIFDGGSPIKQLCHAVFGFQMKVCSGNVMQAVEANPLFLFNKFVATNHAKPWKK